MDWKLILGLSLFGLAMAIGAVFIIPSSIEPAFWLPIFLVSAFLIAKRRATLHFLHGFLVGLANCVWVTGAHIVFANQYLARHANEAAMMRSMPMADSPRFMMALFGPVVGIVSGIIIGLLAFVAGKIVKPSAAPNAVAS